MNQRRIARTLVWCVLLALGCGGGGAGGCGGCGGCLAPIPGGFLPDLRAPNAMTAKVTPSGFDFVEELVADQVSQGLGASQPLPCTDASQRISGPFGTSIELKLHVCDLTEDAACSPADDDPALRVDEPGHGKKCEALAEVKGLSLAPRQNPDGTVDVDVEVQVLMKTGRLPLRVKAPLCSAFMCSIEFDSDDNAPDFLPLVVAVKLRVDPTNGDLLTIDVGGIDNLSQQVDSDELKITSDGGSACRYGCDVLDVDMVKDMLFDRIEGMITRQIRDQIDTFRCRPCDVATNACPSGATCEADQGVCYFEYSPSDTPAQDRRRCPPAMLGVEGRAGLGATLGVGGRSTALDLSVLAGGRHPDGKPSTSVQTGGLVLGVLGGTSVPKRSLCVPPQSWPRRPPATPMDFDAEALLALPGGAPIGAYDLGFAISDGFMDKALYDVWSAGAICAEIGSEQVGVLTSGLFSTFIRSLGQLTHGEDVPMLIALRPRTAPHVVIGRGTTKAGPDGTRVPDDPLLTIEMKDLQIDFYALLEERQARLFSLVTDVTLPLSLEFNPADNTLTPVLAGLETLLTNVRAENIEMLFDSKADLEQLLASLMALVQPQLAGALQPIALPASGGVKVEVKGTRGSVKFANAAGYEHLALFTDLTAMPPSPYTAAAETQAELVQVRVPAKDELARGARPVAVVDVRGLGLTHLGFRGYEFSWRLRGGLWTPWVRGDRLELASPAFLLQGRHDVELRARELDAPETTDATPAMVAVAVDYEAPSVRLELDPETREVRTIARDAVTPVEALAFRYRAAGADWSDAGRAQSFALDALGVNASLEVEVTDEAGHVSRASFGVPADDAREERLANAEDARGCAQAPVVAFALLGLVAIARRRRS